VRFCLMNSSATAAENELNYHRSVVTSFVDENGLKDDEIIMSTTTFDHQLLHKQFKISDSIRTLIGEDLNELAKTLDQYHLFKTNTSKGKYDKFQTYLNKQQEGHAVIGNTDMYFNEVDGGNNGRGSLRANRVVLIPTLLSTSSLLNKLGMKYSFMKLGATAAPPSETKSITLNNEENDNYTLFPSKKSDINSSYFKITRTDTESRAASVFQQQQQQPQNQSGTSASSDNRSDTTSGTSARQNIWRDFLAAFYEKQGTPEKIANIDEILLRWEGREWDMIEILHAKYGLVMSDEQIAMRNRYRAAVAQ
jgi:hypothetical protein